MSNHTVMWKGKEITTLGNFIEVMQSITSDEEVQLFKQELAKGSEYFDDWLFTFVMLSSDVVEAERLLTLFTGKDCHGEFFIVEGPLDTVGNTGFPECVMRVKLNAESYGLRLIILGPSEISNKWTSIVPTGRSFTVTDGPERMLTWDEWSQLVGFRSK